MKNTSLFIFAIIMAHSFICNAQWTTGSGGDIHYSGGHVGIGDTDPDVKLSLGTDITSKKLAIYEGGTDHWYGLGIGAGVLRLQTGNTGARFGFFVGSTGTELMSIHGNGKVEIGDASTSDPDYKLFVEKGIKTGRVKTDAALADYVFEDEYKLMPLPEVESFIWKNKHLPGVISDREVQENDGVELTSFTVSLQEKLEELYLHVIALEKRVKELERENKLLKTQNHE